MDNPSFVLHGACFGYIQRAIRPIPGPVIFMDESPGQLIKEARPALDRKPESDKKGMLSFLLRSVFLLLKCLILELALGIYLFFH
jgi:hypothetical protein